MYRLTRMHSVTDRQTDGQTDRQTVSFQEPIVLFALWLNDKLTRTAKVSEQVNRKCRNMVLQLSTPYADSNYIPSNSPPFEP